MKSKTVPGKSLFGLILILAITAVSTSNTGQSSAPAVIPPANLSGYAVPPKDAHPKIDSALWNLTRTWLTYQPCAGTERATAGGIGDLIRMVVESAPVFEPTFEPTFGRNFHKPLRNIVGKRIEALGGVVERTWGSDIQALLPACSIESLAAMPQILRLRLPFIPRPAEVVSEGVGLSGASSWFSLPSYRTGIDPVKIAILDLGFKGYGDLLGTELPAGTIVRSFRADGDIEAGTAHGSACAEIVHDLAPDAGIYLLNFETDVEFHAAVDYLISEKVAVVSCSLVWTGAGAGDGTGPICRDVVKSAAAGILWVNAAGDDAQSHWQGPFSDTDGDLFQNFSGADEILQWEVPAGAWTRATLTWNDWGTWDGSSYGVPTRDYDLLLWRWNGSAWELLEYCDDWQTGEAGQKPLEQSSLWKTDQKTYYGVSILKFYAIDNSTFDLTVQGNSGSIEYAAAEGSLGIPADAAEAIAVGATVAGTDALLPASSQGPTNDGRIKPDLSAFSGVSTRTFGTAGFSGTSAAAPHVAGALGLMKGKTPYSAAQLRTILEKRALDLGTAGKDNLYGYGRLNLKK